MSLFSSVRDWVQMHSAPANAVRNDVPITEITYGSTMAEFFGLNANGNMPVLTEATAQQVTAINACVNLISGAIAALTLEFFDQDKQGQQTKRQKDALWWMFNREFDARWVAHSGWEFLSRSRLFHGDGFAIIKRRGYEVVGLSPVHPKRVEVAPWPDGSRLVYKVWPESWEKNRDPQILDQDDMLHIPGWGFDGLRSVSPLRYALRMAGGVALATQDFSSQFFSNMQRPDYALTTDKPLSAEQIEELRAQVAEKHGRAAGNAGKPILLQGGLKVEQISLSNEDAELIATRGFQIEEIARAYGVPPWLIGRGEKSSNWGTGLAEQGASFVRYTLRSHLNAFQSEIDRKIFGNPSTFAKFDTFDLERGDIKSMFEAFRMALGRAGEPGFMTRNEVRNEFGLNKVEGGDEFHSGVKENAQSAA